VVAGVVLILMLLQPGGKLQAEAFPMPSQEMCLAAGNAFMAPEPDAHAFRLPGPTATRYAHCVTVQAPGADT
jgi:hypothetical protein